MAHTDASPHDENHDDNESVIVSKVDSNEQVTLEQAASEESSDTDSSLINTEDIDPNPWGAVAVTAILAAVILILWYSMFALNMARG